MRSTLPIGLLALALLAGCGPAADPQAGPPSAPGGAPTSAAGGSGGGGTGPQCPADADILKTLGITVTRDQDPQRFGTTAVVCSYDGKLSNGQGTSVMARLQVGAAAAEYASFTTTLPAQGYTISDRSGVGDKAFTFVLGAGLNGLVALKGDKTIYIAAPASFDQEVALANVFFAS
jgi:hypothetical protein